MLLDEIRIYCVIQATKEYLFTESKPSGVNKFRLKYLDLSKFYKCKNMSSVDSKQSVPIKLKCYLMLHDKALTLTDEAKIDFLFISLCFTSNLLLCPRQIPLPDALPKLVLLQHGAATPASGPWTGHTPPAPHTPWPLTGDSPRHVPLDLWTRRATATVSAHHRIQVE